MAARSVQRPKPEHMTHLRGNILVRKDHPRILFRGWIDALEGELLLAGKTALEEGKAQIAAELKEALELTRSLIRCDVLGEKRTGWTLGGLSPQELRERSHHPEQYYGQAHFMPEMEDSRTLLAVNRARTVARQTELAAYRAFKEPSGSLSREDIQLVLNRMSSFLWIIMVRLKADQGKGR